MDKWVGLSCVEMPETRFEEIMVIPMRSTEMEVAIDKRFLEVCEPGSIIVKSAVPNVPLIIGAFIFNNSVVVRAHGHLSNTTRVVVALSGVRRGRAGRRFPEFTEDQARQNEEFWTQAYGNDP